MALTANLVRASVTQDGTQSTWTDSTVYGTPELNRNQVAVFLSAYKVDEDQVETPLTVSTDQAGAAPKTNSSFTTTNGVDGWHKYYFVIIADWLISTTYNQYDLVWSPSQNLFYEYIYPTPTSGNDVINTTYFLPVADPTTKILNVGTDLESGNLIYQVVEKVLSYQTSICYLKAAAKHAKETCGSDDCGCDSRLGKLYHKIRDLFNNLAINESTGLYLDGEKNARLAEKWCDDCGCLTR